MSPILDINQACKHRISINRLGGGPARWARKPAARNKRSTPRGEVVMSCFAPCSLAKLIASCRIAIETVMTQPDW